MPDPVPLHKEPPVQKVIATGLSITVGLTNDRQMTFQSGFEGDEADASVNARLDRIMAFADRQKARYEIPEIEDELFKHRETLANFIEDRDRVEAAFVTDQASRRIQIEELELQKAAELKEASAKIDADILTIQERKADQVNQGVAEHQRSGKLGSYKPVGARARNIELCDKALDQAKDMKPLALREITDTYDGQIKALHAEIERAGAERDQAVANITISVQRYEDAIAEREDRLAKRKKVAEG